MFPVKWKQAVEKLLLCHCEERFLRRGNLELIDFFNYEIASLRSQRRLKYFFNSLERREPLGSPGIPLADLARMFAPNHLDNLVQFLQKA